MRTFGYTALVLESLKGFVVTGTVTQQTISSEMIPTSTEKSTKSLTSIAKHLPHLTIPVKPSDLMPGHRLKISATVLQVAFYNIYFTFDHSVFFISFQLGLHFAIVSFCINFELKSLQSTLFTDGQ